MSIIYSVGVSAGERNLSNQDLEKILAITSLEGTSDEWIVQRTGIKNRKVTLVKSIGDLALEASVNAFASLKKEIHPVQHIIVATNTPRHGFPNIAGYLQDRLQDNYSDLVQSDSSGVDLGAGCGGINFALMHADGLISSGKLESILVVGAEKLSDVTDYSDRGTCILFGDGASAYILGRGNSGGFIGDYRHGSGRDRGLITCTDKEKVDLRSAIDALERGDRPSKVTGPVLEMNGKKVFAYVVNQWGAVLEKLKDPKFNPEKVSYDEIEYIAPHLANLRCLEAVNQRYPSFLKKCGLLDCENLIDFHNTSTASQGRRVKDFVDNAGSGSYLLSFGYGAGLQACANLYRKPAA